MDLTHCYIYLIHYIDFEFFWLTLLYYDTLD